MSSVIDDRMADLRVITVERAADLTVFKEAEGNGVELIVTNEGAFEISRG